MPAMERLISGFRADGLRVGPLYAVNTLGAVVGVLGSVLWVQPRWGLTGSVIVFAGLQCLCAVMFLWTGRGVRSVEPVTSTVEPGGERLSTSRLRTTLWPTSRFISICSCTSITTGPALAASQIVRHRLNFQDMDPAEIGNLAEGQAGIVDQPGGGGMRHKGGGLIGHEALFLKSRFVAGTGG